MSRPHVAVVVSNDPWVGAFQRHCADHGGAHIVRMVLDPSTLREVDYEVLLTSARWVALNEDLVQRLHRDGRQIVGVWNEQNEKERATLAQLAVDWMVRDTDSMSSFVRGIASVAPLVAEPRAEPTSLPANATPLIEVRGVPGCGQTEIAIGLAAALNQLRPGTALLDCDMGRASIAQRLQLPIEPGLADLASTQVEDLRAFPEREGLAIIPGFQSVVAVAAYEAHAIDSAIAWVRRRASTCVIDASSTGLSSADGGVRSTLGSSTSAHHNTLALVGEGSPVGFTRLVALAAETLPSLGALPVMLVMNRTPKDQHRRHELVTELAELFPGASIAAVPYDPRVAEAAWRGTFVGRGVFTKELRSIANALLIERSIDESHEDLERAHLDESLAVPA